MFSENDAHNRRTLPPTQLHFHLLHHRRQRQHSWTRFLERQGHKHQLP